MRPWPIKPHELFTANVEPRDTIKLEENKGNVATAAWKKKHKKPRNLKLSKYEDTVTCYVTRATHRQADTIQKASQSEVTLTSVSFMHTKKDALISGVNEWIAMNRKLVS